MDIYENHGSDMETYMFFSKINTDHDSNNVITVVTRNLSTCFIRRDYIIFDYNGILYGDKHYITMIIPN